MHNVHECERCNFRSNGRILVGFCIDSDFGEFVCVGLIDRWRTHTQVESNGFATFKENFRVRENSRVIVCEEQRGCPVRWYTGDVQSVRICDQILRAWRRIVHCQIVDCLFTWFNHVIKRLTVIEFHVDLPRQDVRVTYRKPVVVRFIIAFVGIRPGNVSSTAKII